jgi:hypothetical protein
MDTGSHHCPYPDGMNLLLSRRALASCPHTTPFAKSVEGLVIVRLSDNHTDSPVRNLEAT